jgi:phage shock protein A
MAALMGVMKRVSTIFRAKANKALDRMEDPRETLDYSYQTQLELLQKVRRGVADVATSRKRIELQMNQVQQTSEKLDRQAREALSSGREDLAREALTRKAGVQSQFTELQAQYISLQGEEEKLTQASQRLQAKVDAFRVKKETIKATYTAAEAQTRINEVFTGISEEMSDVGLAIQRAEDKTEQMKARAGAIDELMASGALTDVISGPQDDIQAELDRMGAGQGVDAELARMKAELSGASAPKELPGSANPAEAAPGAPGEPAQTAAPAEQSAVPAEQRAVPAEQPASEEVQ